VWHLILPVLLIASSQSPDELLKFYEYDRSLPLNVTMEKIGEEEAFVVYKVYYDSANRIRVPALLIVPKTGKPPYPCIVFLHGYGGRKEDAIPLARVAAPRGYAVFSIDAVLHGERSVPGKQLYSPDFEETSVKGIVQTVIDMRRGLDFLETLEFIDKEKVGYAGGSMGGIIGAIFIGVEPRVKAAVLAVGGGNMSLMVRESEHPAVPPIRERVKELRMSWDEFQKLSEPVEPLNFIWRFSPRPLQLHCGRYDRIVPAEAQRQLAEKAGEPKEVYWYEAGHGLPLHEVVPRALEFFDRHLKGKSPIDKFMERLPLALAITASTIAGFLIAIFKRKA